MILWHRVNPLFFRLVGESGSSWCQKYTSANTFVEIMNFHKIFSLMISLFYYLPPVHYFPFACQGAVRADVVRPHYNRTVLPPIVKLNEIMKLKRKNVLKKCWTDVSLWIRFLFLYSNEKSNNRWKEIETEDTIRRWRPLGYLFFCSYTIHWS